jgi:hypothetical protein
MKKIDFYIIGLLGVGSLLWFITKQIGETAALCFLFFFLGSGLTLLAVALGGRLNDDGQRAFIQGLRELKTVIGTEGREAARTAGYQQRREIGLQYDQMRQQRPPNEQEIAMQQFFDEGNGQSYYQNAQPYYDPSQHDPQSGPYQ